MNRKQKRSRALEGALTGLFYLVAYLAMTWPLAKSFRTRFWFDEGDGLVMIWNLWNAGQAPFRFFHTDALFHPTGVSLIAHSYAPLKSTFFGLLPVSLPVQLNLAIVYSFVAAGVAMYFLARHVGGSRTASLLAGFAFTFSGFHWGHSQGHLNLISTEVIPLFVLAWLLYWERPSWRRAAAVVAVALIVLGTEYYFAIYLLIFALIHLAFRRPRPASFVPLGVLGGAILLPAGLWLLYRFTTGQFVGAHDPHHEALELMALFVPGGHWRFAGLTDGLWTTYSDNIHESTVHIGLALWVAIIWRGRSRFWWTIVAVFAVLAMGPVLTVWGHRFDIPMPYELVTEIFPFMKFGGVPVRMAVMVSLAASVLAAKAFTGLRWRWLAPLALVLVVELLPSPRPSHMLEPPRWVLVLRHHDGEGALIDVITDHKLQMYYQTFHEKPMFGGFLARLPQPVKDERKEIFDRIVDNDVDYLSEKGFRYILAPVEARLDGEELVWRGELLKLFYLRTGEDLLGSSGSRQ